MSSGNFVIRFYEADSGEIHALTQQPESATLSIGGNPNNVIAGPATSPFFAKASRGAKEYGLRPRKIRIRFQAGEEPAGYANCGVLEVVVYEKSQYDSMIIGGTGVYLGQACTMVGRKAENIYPVI